MPKIDYILPMDAEQRIFFLVYPGFELLDMSGPAGVFHAGNKEGDLSLFRPDFRLSAERRYEVRAVSVDGGLVESGCGIAVDTGAIEDLAPKPCDTLLVTGAIPQHLEPAMADARLTGWLSRTARRFGRYGSVCSGTFLLAASGLLRGRTVTTHWDGCRALADMCPETIVLGDDLYVQDGSMWTSAGVTTGIDMALAILEQDHGRAHMRETAKLLVVYAHRPGNQSQYSSLIDSQTTVEGRLRDLALWVEQNLDRPLKVAEMAEFAGFSERSFFRRFTDAFGQTPQKFVENARLQKAQRLLEANSPVKYVAGEVGFRSEAAFRTAFTRRFGLSPSLHRRIHAGADRGENQTT